jgi:aminoglycoside phosphotransferase (APT) family kinase protein
VSQAAVARAGPVIEAEAFTAWADQALPALGDGPLTQQVLAGGSSNIVIRVGRGGTPMIVRRPPLAPRPDSLKVIAREARVLEALRDTPVPCPAFEAYCDEAGVIGAPFYVMANVNGFVGYPFDKLPPPYDQQGEPRRRMAIALVDALAELAKVDYRAAGLADFGKPEGFLERQVDRWTSQLASYRESEAYEQRDLPGLGYVIDWLRDNTPEMSPPGVLHGDYSFANAIFAHEEPPRVAAMIDWELATIGDPLLDLGLVLYPFNGRNERTPPAGYFDPTGFPCREELAERWSERSGRKVENINYYMVLIQFKMAVILERQHARVLNGKQSRALGGFAETMVPGLVRKAEAMARGEG